MSQKSRNSKRRTESKVVSAEEAAREQQQITQRLIVSGQARSGPWPDSEEMERYARIDPAFPAAIVDMAPKAQEHYMLMDREQAKLEARNLDLAEKEAEIRTEVVANHYRYFGRGQYIGLIFGLAGFGLAALTTSQGEATAGAATAAAVVAALGGVFAIGKWSERKADEEKARRERGSKATK